jgi:pyrimidine-nucleoside phosphorylase
MTVYDIISIKRDGGEHSQQQLAYLIDGLTKSEIPDYQLSAWLMAVYLKGMTDTEKWYLTEAMLHSGQLVDLHPIHGIKVDKHSTGGVGDKTSIILAPIVAATGIPVPMISGRGLGHTGGTLDKLQSIPGFRVDYSIDDFKKIMADLGVCLIGQTKDIAPADKKLYALRDVTATIQSIPLISASIMSKKLAEGIDALVLDVKTGYGAFMQDYENALQLAKSLISIGTQAGKKTVAYITNMDQPLGNAIGNWLEMAECINALKGNGPEDLMALTHQLSGTMIWLGKKAGSVEDGIEISREMISSGKAWEKFVQIIERQQGSLDIIENPGSYPRAKYNFELKSEKKGYIAEMNALTFGLCSVELGAGRAKQDDVIDPAAGILLHKKVGDQIAVNETIATIYSESSNKFDVLGQRLKEAVLIKEHAAEPQKLIFEYLDSTNLK